MPCPDIGDELNDALSSSPTRPLDQTLARASLTDAAGQPLVYRPHDFRRMFATEGVTGGLPVHIVARLLGHKNITTSQAYMAIFDEELVRSYRAFLDNRRAQRPEAEYREPTEEEWREFQQHFQLHKLELGECVRPYGTPSRHEFACIRCPSLRLDLSARPRPVEIIANLRTASRKPSSPRVASLMRTLRQSFSSSMAMLMKRSDHHRCGARRSADRQPNG